MMQATFRTRLDVRWGKHILGAQKLYWTDPRVTAGRDPIELGANVTGKGVGWSTVHYSMVALRMHESDFHVRTQDGVAQDWPIRCEDLEPYYEEVESDLGISGPVHWPWGPKRRGPYPYRSHPFNSVAMLFIRGCETKPHPPWPLLWISTKPIRAMTMYGAIRSNRLDLSRRYLPGKRMPTWGCGARNCYFLDLSNSENGLIADSTWESAPSSIAAVGFGLKCYAVGVNHGWISRDN